MYSFDDVGLTRIFLARQEIICRKTHGWAWHKFVLFFIHNFYAPKSWKIEEPNITSSIMKITSFLFLLASQGAEVCLCYNSINPSVPFRLLSSNSFFLLIIVTFSNPSLIDYRLENLRKRPTAVLWVPASEPTLATQDHSMYLEAMSRSLLAATACPSNTTWQV